MDGTGRVRARNARLPMSGGARPSVPLAAWPARGARAPDGIQAGGYCPFRDGRYEELLQTSLGVPRHARAESVWQSESIGQSPSNDSLPPPARSRKRQPWPGGQLQPRGAAATHQGLDRSARSLMLPAARYFRAIVSYSVDGCWSPTDLTVGAQSKPVSGSTASTVP